MLFIYVVFHNNIFNSEKKAYLSITGENRGNEREIKEKSKKEVGTIQQPILIIHFLQIFQRIQVSHLYKSNDR
jgi:hypothetical protein